MSPAPRLPLLLTAVAIAAANFMNILDTTIAVVSLPAIAGSLGATPSQGTWVLTSYAICLAVMLPLSGWICTRYGQIKTFVVSIGVFTLTSWLCGMSTNFELLVFFRALQGLSSGLIVPLSQMVLLRVYPPEQHGFAIGLWSLTAGVAPVLGPIIGGSLTDSVGWQWIFYMNIPIGLVCGWIIWSSMHHAESEKLKKPVDGVGLILMATTVLLFQLIMDKGHELDWFGSPPLRLALNVAVIAFVGLVVWERKEPHPIIDYSLLKVPSYVACTVMAVIFYITYYTTTVLYPIWMQSVLGYTATWAGLAMAGTSLVPLFGMMIVGKNLARLNLRHLIIVGSLVVAYGIYLQSTASTDTTFSAIFYARVIMGIGFGFLFPPLMALSLTGIPAEKSASAAAFFNFFRMFASSLGIAIGITVWQNRTVFHRQRLIEDISLYSPTKESALEPILALTAGNESAMWAVVDHLASLQASTLGLGDTFIACAIAYGAIILLTLLVPARMRRAPAQPQAQETAHD